MHGLPYPTRVAKLPGVVWARARPIKRGNAVEEPGLGVDGAALKIVGRDEGGLLVRVVVRE